MSELSIYREVILEEYMHPQNKHVLDTATITHHEKNPLCGDEITIYAVVKDGLVADISWDGQGCAISQAAASLFTEHIKGKPVAEIESMSEKDITNLLGITPNPMRMKCAVLIMKTTAKALDKLRVNPVEP